MCPVQKGHVSVTRHLDCRILSQGASSILTLGGILPSAHYFFLPIKVMSVMVMRLGWGYGRAGVRKSVGREKEKGICNFYIFLVFLKRPFTIKATIF